MATQQVNLPDGLYYASNSTASHKSTLFSGLVTGPLAIAGAAAAVLVSAVKSYGRASKAAAGAGSPIPGLEEQADPAVGGVVTPTPSVAPPPAKSKVNPPSAPRPRARRGR